MLAIVVPPGWDLTSKAKLFGWKVKHGKSEADVTQTAYWAAALWPERNARA
jgi:hypothetical protein